MLFFPFSSTPPGATKQLLPARRYSWILQKRIDIGPLFQVFLKFTLYRRVNNLRCVTQMLPPAERPTSLHNLREMRKNSALGILFAHFQPVLFPSTSIHKVFQTSSFWVRPPTIRLQRSVSVSQPSTNIQNFNTDVSRQISLSIGFLVGPGCRARPIHNIQTTSPQNCTREFVPNRKTLWRAGERNEVSYLLCLQPIMSLATTS